MTINDLKNLHTAPVPAGKKFTDRIDEEGRLRIAAFIHALQGWDGPAATAEKIIGSGRVGRTTLDRVRRGERVSDTTLRAMGDVLDLPRDFLLYIGRAQVDRIERLLPEADNDFRDLLRWTLDLFETEPDDESVSA